MIDPKQIFKDLLNPDNSASPNNTASKNSTNKPASSVPSSTFSVVDLIGGLFGGNEKGNILEGLIKGGGLAAIASVAFDALKNFEKHDENANSKVDMTEVGQTGADHNGDFALTLVRAMITAAKADGHVDDKERALIQNKIASSGIDQKTASFLMDELNKPVDLDNLVSNVNTDEQKTELYVASRMTLDPDKPDNRQYLDNLMDKLGLPKDLEQHIEQAIVSFLR